MKRYQLSNGKTITKPRSYFIPVLIIILIFFYISVRVTGFDLKVIVERGEQFFVILGQMFPPQISYAKSIWTPLIDTVKMSLLGSIAAVPSAVAASTNIVKNRIVVGIVRLFIGIVRTLPTLVTALIATYVFGLGTLAGTTALLFLHLLM